MSLRAPLKLRLADEDAERVRLSHDEKIRELQALPFAAANILTNVTLADGVLAIVPHRLGRAPYWVSVGVPRTASTAAISSTGRIVEVRDGTHDATQVVALKATGWGVTVIVDLAVL